MGIFLKRSGGSVTVLAALILVPTVFFTGFLVDLARLKLYGNQAVMTADNYGEAVIAQYDNLLKELYGLFAVTQDDEAIRQLDELQEYMRTSFNPSSNQISWGHLTQVQELAGKTEYEGFMPYQSANVVVGYEFVENANLASHEIMSTQIGDFMKFRIAQQLLKADFDVLEAVDSVQKMENDTKAIDKKLEIDKKSEELYRAAQEYYVVLKDLAAYPEYIAGINEALRACKSDFTRIAESDSYQIYYDYQTSDHNAINAALEKQSKIDEAHTPSGNSSGETLSESEQKLVDIYNAYRNDENARRDKLEEKLDLGIKALEDSTRADPICFDNYEAKLNALKAAAGTVSSKAGDLEQLRAQLKDMLAEPELTRELKSGLEEELSRMEALFNQIDTYTGIAAYIDRENTSVNTAYKQQTESMAEKLGDIKDKYLECGEPPEYPQALDGSKWKKFESDISYRNLFDSLERCFGSDGASEEGQRKKDAADRLLNEAKAQMEVSESSSARDIPEAFGYGATYNRGFDFGNLVGEAVDCFSVNSFLNEANKLLLKIYTVQYDFGMFSSRVTNVKDEEQAETSLTGYVKDADINYLYQAELEYIMGGSNSSDENLNAARNKILAIRTVANFTATYSVDEINSAIQGISNAAAAVNPVLGLVVNGALRITVAGVETTADWNELKNGESVALIKTQLKHMTAYGMLCGLLNLPESSQGGQTGEGIQMDYEQYLMVMLVFLTSSDTIAERTANLIELNVNAVRQGIGKNGSLSELQFKMKDAYTAVNATCTVQLDFVVMPRGFARSMTSEDGFNSLLEFERNSYKFTVTRGY